MKDEQIEKLKYELIDRYIALMMIIFVIYAIIFMFFIYDRIMFWYLIAGITFSGYSYLLVRKKYSTNFIVNVYLIHAPAYSFYVTLAFWNNSVASFCWLLPLPLGASIFFSNRTVLYYTIYSIMIIIIDYITANNFNFNFPKYSQEEIAFTDTILFISNILIIVLLIYYKDKIKKLEMLSNIETENFQENLQNSIEMPSENIDAENMEKLFERIEAIMIQNMLFKDVKFNLSKLSVILDINSTYISRAIRYKGYANFNNYLNIYRINYVKKLFIEIDFQKATLMYIYTESGFSNQSTFNRVFKQIEGITPSEYIQSLQDNYVDCGSGASHF